jgi:ABC-type Mn2+/Zn2+ transport system ATPase subunit
MTVVAPGPDPDRTDEAADPVRTIGLSVGYEGRPIVASIEVTVRRQTSLALVGTNGSGKSTLLKSIVGLVKPVAGTLSVFGRTPGTTPRRMAYLSQFHPSGFVLPLQAVEVVRMGRYPELGLLGRMSREDHDLVAWAMETMGVDRYADQSLRALSGGQQQRVYLEAFAGELQRGAALVTATHDIQEAAEYDQVMLLARKVVALGRGREVLTAEALLETFGMFIRGTGQQERFIVADRGGREVDPHERIDPGD